MKAQAVLILHLPVSHPFVYFFMYMDHCYNSSACFYRKCDCIFEAKIDGYIGNNFYLDL